MLGGEECKASSTGRRKCKAIILCFGCLGFLGHGINLGKSIIKGFRGCISRNNILESAHHGLHLMIAKYQIFLPYSLAKSLRIPSSLYLSPFYRTLRHSSLKDKQKKLMECDEKILGYHLRITGHRRYSNN